MEFEDELGEEFEDEELAQSYASSGRVVFYAVRAGTHDWFEEHEAEILEAIKDGVREGTLEFLEDLRAKHPYLFRLNAS